MNKTDFFLGRITDNVEQTGLDCASHEDQDQHSYPQVQDWRLHAV